MTEEDVRRKREAFWDTEPHFGGNRIIWDTIKAATETDIESAVLLFETAGIIVADENMLTLYDESGEMYKMPPLVWTLPRNLATS
jgi:hypothetical protein